MKRSYRSLLVIVAVLAMTMSMYATVFADDTVSIDDVRASIQALSADPTEYTLDDKKTVEEIQDDFEALSEEDQATLDSECTHSGTGQSLGRVLESAVWAVRSYETDISTSLPTGTYTTTTEPPVSSQSSKGKSDSSRVRNWWVESVVVDDEQAIAYIYVTDGAATKKKLTSYPSVWVGGENIARDDNNNYAIPVDLNGTTYFAGVSSSMSSPIMYSLNTVISEPINKLSIKNKTTMIQAVTASVENIDGEKTLVMALSGTGYHELFKGTYEDAVANGDNTENWIHGYENDEGKWEFRIPIDEEETHIPIVSISNRYYNNYLAGKNGIERAFYPRQLDINESLGTLVTDDFHASYEIAVVNNISMFSPGKSAIVNVTGGPNSESYKVTLTLPMKSTSMTKVKGVEFAVEKGVLYEKGESDEIDLAITDDTYVFNEIPIADGRMITLQFWSKKNSDWYKRSFTLDLAEKKAVFDPYKAGSRFFAMSEEELLDYVKKNKNAALLNELIEAIQVQYRDENTDKLCKAAKLCWDLLAPDLGEEDDIDDGYFSDDTGDASADDPLNTAPDKDKELLVVSFGTSFNDSRAATIGAVEKALQKTYKNFAVRRAFTAQIIINHVASRDGEQIDNVQQAMDKAVAAGVKYMVVQPTHLMSGYEYDELKEEIDKYADKIKITYAKPLLTSDVDKTTVARELVKEAVAKAGFNSAADAADNKTAFVFMGHGTGHEANVTYTQMQEKMAELGYDNCFVGTVEGNPPETALPEIKKAVEKAGYTKVVLRPMMVVAGDHANNDMADEEEGSGSWFDGFARGGVLDEVEGYDGPVDLGDGFGVENVECQINGLGEIKAIQMLYIVHSGDAMATGQAQEGLKEINSLILKFATDKDVLAAYDMVLAYFDEYRAYADLVVTALKMGETDQLVEYCSMLDEYIKLGNKYAVEFQEMPEVREALLVTLEKAEVLREILEENGIYGPEDIPGKIDEIKEAIEKAQADFEEAINDLFDAITEELLEEATQALIEQAKDWAKEAGFTDEDIDDFIEQAKALQAIIEEYAGLEPSEAMDKLIEDAKQLLADNSDYLMDLAMEELGVLQDLWDDGAFDEYLEQAGLDKDAIEDLVNDIIEYAMGYADGKSYTELQRLLEEAGVELDELAEELAELKDTVEALKAAKEDAESKVAQLEKELEDEKNKSQADQNKIAQLENDKAAAEADLAKYENALKVMKKRPALNKKKTKNVKKKKIVVKWKGLKGAKATSYQISYKVGKKTKKKMVKKATSTNKALKSTLKKMKMKRKYTVKVRAVYKFKFNGKNYTVYSKWSKAKKVKIKK